MSVKENGPDLKFKAQLEDTWLAAGWKFLVFCAAFFSEQGGCRKKLGSDLNNTC